MTKVTKDDHWRVSIFKCEQDIQGFRAEKWCVSNKARMTTKDDKREFQNKGEKI